MIEGQKDSEAGEVYKGGERTPWLSRIATRRWRGSATAIRKLLKWPLLASRRHYHKLLLCRKILTGISIIPQSVFTPHPYSSVRLPNPCPIFIPYVCSNYHRSSFFVSSIPLWNSLSESLVGLSSYLAFKRHLKLFLQVKLTVRLYHSLFALFLVLLLLLYFG